MGKLKRRADMSGLFGGYYVDKEQFDLLIIGSGEAGKTGFNARDIDVPWSPDVS